MKMGRACVETYPCLAILGMLPEFLERGIVARYNPSRKTFEQSDWKKLCEGIAIYLEEAGLADWDKWCKKMAALNRKPSKQEQDQLDSLICFLSGLVLWRYGLNAGMIVGDTERGYISSPANTQLVNLLRPSAASKGVSLVCNL
jgi:predicted RNase H-like nuclease